MLTELTLFATFALHHTLIGAALFAVLLLVNKLIKSSPETQSWLWSTAFVLCTLLPFTLFIPTWQPFEPNATPASTQSVQIASNAQSENPAGAVMQESVLWNVPADSVQNVTPWLIGFLVIWAVGSAWRFLQVGTSLRSTGHLIKSARPLTLNNWRDAIPVRQSDDAATPMAVGIVRPVIIVPSTFLSSFSEQQLLPVLLHEKAHIDRRDLWMGFFQELLAIVFWWSPVMRLLNRKIHLARELSCDLRACTGLANKKLYAQSLLDCTRLMLTQHKNAMAMGLFSKKKDLEARVELVLSNTSTRSPNMLKTISLCTVLAVSSFAIAEQYAPKVSVADVQRSSNHFSSLSRAKGELLMEAIRDSDESLLAMMIDNGLDINTPIKGDGTALIVAVKYDNAYMLNKLIEMGADVNQSARGDGNPLIAAAQTNNVGFAEVLLQRGADINAIVPGDETPLIKASWNGHFEMVEFLVNNGADVNLGVDAKTRSGTEYRSPLNKAASDKIETFLIENGAVQ